MPVRGERIVVAGSGPLLLAVADTARRHGAHVVAVIEQAPLGRVARFVASLALTPGKLAQAIPPGGVRYTGSVVKAHGSGRVEAVTPRARGRDRTIAADRIACGYATGSCRMRRWRSHSAARRTKPTARSASTMRNALRSTMSTQRVNAPASAGWKMQARRARSAGLRTRRRRARDAAPRHLAMSMRRRTAWRCRRARTLARCQAADALRHGAVSGTHLRRGGVRLLRLASRGAASAVRAGAHGYADRCARCLRTARRLHSGASANFVRVRALL